VKLVKEGEMGETSEKFKALLDPRGAAFVGVAAFGFYPPSVVG